MSEKQGDETIHFKNVGRLIDAPDELKERVGIKMEGSFPDMRILGLFRTATS